MAQNDGKKLYRIEYTDDMDPGCALFSMVLRAYDAEDAQDRFFDGDADGWCIKSIRSVGELPRECGGTYYDTPSGYGAACDRCHRVSISAEHGDRCGERPVDACGHSVCGQSWLDSGDAACVQHERTSA